MPPFNNQCHKSSSGGFTLIELLVVIAIIGLLAVIALISLGNARANARDAKRLADMKQVQTALALYYDSTGHYPTNEEISSGKLSFYSPSAGTTTFMEVIPSAPMPADGPCSAAQTAYTYNAPADGSTYTIDFCISKKNGDLPAGNLIAWSGGISWGTTGNSGGNDNGNEDKSFNPGHVATISNGDNGTVLNSPSFMATYGSYAYITNSGADSIEVLGISDFNSPVHVTTVYDGDDGAIISAPYSIAFYNHYAYVINRGDDSLEVLDLSSPASPVHASNINNNDSGTSFSSIFSIAIYDHYAYVSSLGNNSIEVLDLSDPANPVHVATISNGDNGIIIEGPQSITVYSHYAYIANYNGSSLEVLDLSDPASPTHVSTLYNGDNNLNINYPYAMIVSGTYAYLSNEGSGIEILSLTDPSNPVHVGHIANGQDGASLNCVYSLTVAGDYLIAPDNCNNSLEVIDISDKSNPAHQATLGDGQGEAILSNPSAVLVSGDHAYVANAGNSTLEIVYLYAPVIPVCQPDCTAKACGDDGCGGTCGSCVGSLAYCNSGICECTPDCSGKTCGDNGCGGTCGTCSGGALSTCYNSNCLDCNPVEDPTDMSVPRISVWQGKVNQHWDLNTHLWTTDADGVSGAEYLGLGYCKKFYPDSVMMMNYKVEYINTWRDRGNVGGPYAGNWQSYRCVQASECSSGYGY